MRILVQRCDALGDLILALPVLTVLKYNYPSAEIDLLCKPEWIPLVQNHPSLSECIPDKLAGVTNPKFKQIRAFARELRSKQYSIYISLWGNPVYAWLGWLAGIRTRVGDYNNPWTRLLYNNGCRINWKDQERHQLEFNLDHLKGLVLSAKQISINLPPSINPTIVLREAEIFTARELLKSKPIEPQKETIAISVGTGGSNIEWKNTHYARMIESFQADYNILLLGTTDQQIKAEDILSHVKKTSTRVINLTGQLSLSEFAAILSRCHYHIGGDTGATHLAAALGIPCLVIHTARAQRPTRWGPWLVPQRMARKPLNCKMICRLQRCSLKNCGEQVTPEEVRKEFELLHRHIPAFRSKYPTEKEKIAANRDYWIRKTANILLLRMDKSVSTGSEAHEVQIKLEKKDLHVLTLPPRPGFAKILAVLKEEDITEIQMLGRGFRWPVRLAAWMIGAVYAYNPPRVVGRLPANLR